MTIEFFMAMDPPTATAQEHKVKVVNGKPVFFDPPKLKAAKAKLTAHLGKHRPAAPIEGAVELLVKWCFPKKNIKTPAYRTARPDTDNLNKLLKDCMTKSGFWKDDAQVVREIIEKFDVNETPGIYIRVTDLSAIRKLEVEDEC